MRIRDQVFSSPSGVPLRFDLLAPESDHPLPLMVCIHGGGWISGDKEDMDDIVSLFASNGYAVAAPQYRLAPLYPFPAAIIDTMNFVRYARANAKELNILPDSICSLGNSAGGHLASMLGVLDRMPEEPAETPSARVQAVVDLCGISDINDPRVQHNPIAWSFLEQFMDVPYEGHEDRFALASPITHVDKHSAAFLIIHGDRDDIVPIDQSERMVAALTGHLRPVEFVAVPGEGHAFSYEAWPFLAQTALDFLGRTLSQGADPRFAMRDS
jgi:acetyl esterase/lipase